MTIPAELWPQLSRLLDEAMNLAGDELDAWLVRLDGNDPVLAPHLRRLLEAHAQPSADDPLRASPSLLIASALAQQDPTAALAAGQMLGPYRLVQPLGEGGMASVWLAEQTLNVRRRVALKIPHPGLEDPRATAARFAQECDFLAGLEHPHIARIYDAGASVDGLPYLAMEWIDGVQITRYADAHRLGVGARVDLFQQVLSAVRFAHGRLVLHRDIKPSNILVTPTGEVKLLDFGIARLLGESGQGEDVAPAVAASRALTPESASPEQLAGTTLTTPSDVYSLGVVLYELLGGRRPYRLDAVATGGDAAAAHAAVLDARIEPVSMTAFDEATAACRGTTPRLLRRQLSGDLDAIVAKALMKHPEDRFESAEAMAADLARWRRASPVMARRAGVGHRTWLFVSRHRAMVAAGTAMTLALSVGLGVALWEARLARQEARVSQSVQDFAVSLFVANDPQQAQGRDIGARELLDRGAARLDTELQDQPAALARLHQEIGDIYIQLGSNVQARPHIEKAIALYRSIGQEGSERAIDTHYSLTELLEEDMQFEPARLAGERCLALADASFGPSNRWRLPVNRNLAWMDAEQGHPQAAVDRLTAELAAVDRDGRPHDIQVVKARTIIANAYLELGRYALARDGFLASLKDGVALHEDVTDELVDRYNLARARYALGETDVTARELQTLVGEMDKHVGMQHDRTIKARSLWAQSLAEDGQYRRAVEVQRVNLEAARARNTADDDVVHLQELTLAKMLKITMQPQEGLPLARSGLAFMDAKYADPTWLTEVARRLTAELQIESGDLVGAMRSVDLAIERAQRIHSHDTNTQFADLLQARAVVLRLRNRAGDLPEAIALLRQAEAIDTQSLGAGSRVSLRCAAHRAWLEAQVSTADAAAAERFQQAATRYETSLPATHLARAELELMRATIVARDATTASARAQAAAHERAGRQAWKTALGVDYAPPLLILH